jgi:hypothetical protein
MLRVITITLVCYFLSIGFGLAQVDKGVEIEKLTIGLDSESQIQRTDSVKYMLKFRINEQTLNEKIEKILRAGYGQDGNNKHTQEMILMVKALSASGDIRYADLLREVALIAPSGDLRASALESIDLLYEYEQDKPNALKTVSSGHGKLINMLKSENLKSRRNAAKTVSNNIEMPDEVYAAARDSLVTMANDFRSENLYVDTMSWLCKALASSGESKYIEDLMYVRSNVNSRKLTKYATRAIDSLVVPMTVELQPGETLLDKSSGLEFLVLKTSKLEWLVLKTSKLEWFVPSDSSSRYTLDSGINVCTHLGEYIKRDMCVPSLRDYEELWKTEKHSDLKESFAKKSYLSTELELDGTARLPLEFSFATGMATNTYSSRVACVPVKCDRSIGRQK